MTDSILETIQDMIGPSATYDAYETDLITFINTAFNVLTQLGCGPQEGFAITGKTETWSDFVTDKKLNLVKTYVYVRAKMMFDPPASSATQEVMKNLASELEFRIRTECDDWGVPNE